MSMKVTPNYGPKMNEKGLIVTVALQSNKCARQLTPAVSEEAKAREMKRARIRARLATSLKEDKENKALLVKTRHLLTKAAMENNNTCTVCGVKFKSESSVQDHMKRRHPAPSMAAASPALQAWASADDRNPAK